MYMYVCIYEWIEVFSLISDSSVGLSAGIQSTGDSVPETLWVRILHSAEENNLSPFEINNNKYVYMYVYKYVYM